MAKRVHQGKNKICTRYDTKRKIKAHFIPRDYAVKIFYKFENFRQGAKSVRAYLFQFQGYYSRVNYFENDYLLIMRF